MIAASAHAFVTGRKTAGLYDHATKMHLRVAAESRGRHLQGYDGGRDMRFGGTLPELRDAGGEASVYMRVEGGTIEGYERNASIHFTGHVSEGVIQVYDHGAGAWFAFNVQVG